METCPICSQKVMADKIEEHVNICLESINPNLLFFLEIKLIRIFFVHSNPSPQPIAEPVFAREPESSFDYNTYHQPPNPHKTLPHIPCT